MLYKQKLLEKISTRLYNAIDLLNLDNSGYNCIEEIQDQLDDLGDILFNYKEDDGVYYCKDCIFFETKNTLYVGEWYNCRWHNTQTRFLHGCPHFHKREADEC